jgi:hypothetical protein
VELASLVLANHLVNIRNCLRVSEGGLDTIRDDLGDQNDRWIDRYRL